MRKATVSLMEFWCNVVTRAEREDMLKMGIITEEDFILFEKRYTHVQHS